MKRWVDFRAVKTAVRMEMVLRRYALKGLHRSAEDRVRGRCPIHHGAGENAFHVSLSKNVFHCFSCGAHGNVLDFVARMEKCSIREAALLLQEWFAVPAREPSEPVEPQLVTEKRIVHPPLRFRLPLDATHPYLAARGLQPQTTAHFGVGFYAGPGLMSGRVVIPIHDERGQLVAYCGRTIEHSEPRYKFPPGFQKSRVLFHLHYAAPLPAQKVVLVEGFFGCMKVYQAGFPNVAALMGATLAPAQEELLCSRFAEIILLLDGDAAGRLATREIADRLVQRRTVQVLHLPPGVQPDSLAEDAIRCLLAPTGVASGDS
ncbi:MAG TPA: CHC2 zinc finger domain-containing protein [Candidatus Methylomirabilis sp.]|nr:CHC2 zinc finger domain-containing protein [Candidatus Methylomirabilis sp.]